MGIARVAETDADAESRRGSSTGAPHEPRPSSPQDSAVRTVSRHRLRSRSGLRATSPPPAQVRWGQIEIFCTRGSPEHCSRERDFEPRDLRTFRRCADRVSSCRLAQHRLLFPHQSSAVQIASKNTKTLFGSMGSLQSCRDWSQSCR